MPRRPWHTNDKLNARSLCQVTLCLASLAGASVLGGCNDSDSDSSDSSRSSGGWSHDGDHDWRALLLQAQGGLLTAADAPYRRPGVRFAIGPERYSFARVARQWGDSTSCMATFRFDLGALRELLVALRFPPVVRLRDATTGEVRLRATGEEALLLLLRRLSYPSNFHDLTWEAGRSTTQLCELFQWATDHVYETFPHLRDSRSLECWGPHMPRFATAIHRGGNSRNGRRQQCPLTNCFLFVDGSNQRTCRPSQLQHILYNGHKHCHCVKWQGLMLPNGIMPYPFGPINGRNHDSFMLERSRLVRILRRMSRQHGRVFCVYGDPAYPQSRYVCGPFRDLYPNTLQATFNRDMSRCRIPNEWGFGKLRSNFAYIDYNKCNQVFLNDIERLWPVAQILTNCHTCLYGSQAAGYYEVRPPDLAVYVRMGENLPVRRY